MPAKKKPEYHKAEQLATYINLSIERFHSLVRQKIIPRVDRGKFDKDAVVQAYIRFLQDAVQRRSGVDEESSKIKQQELQERVRKLKLENDERASKVLNVEDVQIMVNETMAIAVASLEALPGRCATELADVSDRALIRQRLHDEVRQTRTDMADRLSRLAELGVGSGDHKAAAKKNARSVGKRKSSPAKRKRGTRKVAK